MSKFTKDLIGGMFVRKILATLLAVITIFSCCSLAAFAETRSISDAIYDYIGNKSKSANMWEGNAARVAKEITGFKDPVHVISPCDGTKGLSVELVACAEPGYESKIFHAEYQWYSCTDLKYSNAKKIDGASGKAFDTDEFNEPGNYYFFCKKTIYQNIIGKAVPVFSCLTNVFEVIYTGLPTVYVDTPDGKLINSNSEWTQGASIRISSGLEDKYSLDDTTIRIKGRGSSSWNISSKNGYTFKFDKKQNLFGLGKDKTWALVGNFSDKSLLRNWLASELDENVYDDGSEWNVQHISVDLVMNGEYRGNYTLATTVRIGSNRIDIPDISDSIDKDVNGDGSLNLYDGGFVVEVNERQDETYNFTTNHGFGMSLSDPDLDEPADSNEAIYQHIVNVIQTAEDALYSDSFADAESGYAKYIDVDSFVDYYLLKELAKDVDGNFRLSTYIYYQPEDGKLHMAPCWDFDIAFGNVNYDGCDKYTGLQCRAGWYARLFEDPVFEAKVAEKWNNTKPLLMSVLNNELPSQIEKVRISANANFERWPILGVYTWPAPSGVMGRQTWNSELNYLTNWILNRITYLDSVFNG